MADQSSNVDAAHDERTLLIAEAALSEVIRRRRAGDLIDDESVLTEHPEVRDLLAPRLAKLRLVERALGPHLRSADATASSNVLEAPARALNVPKISDRYEVLREINHGGQAVIFLARDRDTGRNVAIKVLRSGALADDRERHRFEREAHILSQLNHPNIVAILDRGHTPDGLMYLVMNYIPGEPLVAESLTGRTLAERLSLFVTICRTVQVAHERRIIHRDLKPSNIRIDDRGSPHVLDFGLAVSAQSLFASMTVTGQFLGTFLWASPEQAAGKGEITSASDVYSLGVILYQLATGGAFPAQVFAVVSEAIERRGSRVYAAPSSRDRARPRTQAATISPALHELIDRALARDPKERFANAGALADAVEQFLASPDTSHTASPKRGRTLSLIGLAACVAVIAILLMTQTAPTVPAGATADREHIVNGRPTIWIAGREFYWIPPGEAVLGSAGDAPYRGGDEKQHRVVFKKGFYLACYELDREWYGQVMGVDPPSPVAIAVQDVPRDIAVVNVSWHDAQEFCRRVSKKTGLKIRMPTEDEWEYAARAGSTEPYPEFIDVQTMAWPLASQFVNFSDRSSPLKARDARYDDASATIATNVKYMGNAWELRNTFGNVWEWTAEPYRQDLSLPATQPATAPTLVSTRGGSWTDDPLTFRYSNRNPLKPDFKQDNVGFRVMCDEQ